MDNHLFKVFSRKKGISNKMKENRKKVKNQIADNYALSFFFLFHFTLKTILFDQYHHSIWPNLRKSSISMYILNFLTWHNYVNKYFLPKKKSIYVKWSNTSFVNHSRFFLKWERKNWQFDWRNIVFLFLAYFKRKYISCCLLFVCLCATFNFNFFQQYQAQKRYRSIVSSWYIHDFSSWIGS